MLEGCRFRDGTMDGGISRIIGRQKPAGKPGIYHLLMHVTSGVSALPGGVLVPSYCNLYVERASTARQVVQKVQQVQPYGTPTSTGTSPLL